MGRRSFLKSLGIGLGAAVLGGGVGGLLEYFELQKYEDITKELLRGADFVKEIRGIQIYMDINSKRKNGPLLDTLIERLEPMISILPEEMVRRIRFIRLDAFVDDSIFVPFEGKSFIGVEGMILVAYPNNIENGISLEKEEKEEEIEEEIEEIEEIKEIKKVKKRLREVFFHEAVHLMTYGNPNKLRLFRQRELDQCKIPEECIVSLTDLIDNQSLKQWRQISRQNGGYVSDGRIRPDQIIETDLLGYRNFGYILDNPKLRYGRLSLAEDIACVFEKILSSLYRVIHRNEDAEIVISDLLSKTSGETGLHKKYLIACKSLTKWYEKDSKQHKTLTEFIRIIEDAIKAGGTTGGQGRSIESLMERLDAIREAGRATNQSNQTNQGAIAHQETAGVQETPLGWLMRQRFTNTGKSAGQGQS